MYVDLEEGAPKAKNLGRFSSCRLVAPFFLLFSRSIRFSFAPLRLGHFFVAMEIRKNRALNQNAKKINKHTHARGNEREKKNKNGS